MKNLEQGKIGARSYRDIRWQLFILGFFRFSEALAWTSIFPYVFLMIKSLLPENETQAARAAALASSVVALFTFGEFLMGLPWAKVSDRIGRKWTLMIGAVGGIISALGFGLSRSLSVALAARVFGGLINPNVGVISACVGELVKGDIDEGKAYSVVPFLRALGGLIGPVLGGWLADPVKSMPSIFSRGSMWEKYPYLLPNLIVALCLACSGLLGFFFLEETHPHLQSRRDIGLEVFRWVSRTTKKAMGTLSRVNVSLYMALPSSGEDAIPLDHIRDVELNSDEENTEPAEDEALTLELPLRNTYTPQVILQILAASILAFHKVSSDVIIPIFLGKDYDSGSTPSTPSTPDSRKREVFKFTVGFGMSPVGISNVLLSQAVVAIIAQVLIVPKVISRWGALKSFRWAAVIFPWLYCLTPFTARVTHPLSTVCMLVDIWIKGVLANLGYVGSNILLTKTSPSRLHLATINGAAASASCLARSIGAAVSGSMFRVGLQDGVIGLPFWTLSAIAGVGSVLSFFLRDEP
ncbi:hypothetical protein AJ79_08238 [Helicocarpus griseus UAMH5409]|uniref:Major facilitator superfamily (MFS) profile domain-containing protein n=1 Tax=Helicocarpus griseus UAMH5409 TaxID=1447875 RepID=A0A2B7WUT3_9EURO|nr:hypothetical protein AJ79_08238 [Helicocarpus griseus UAMH5409]